jgi:hypothetical protein
MKRALNDTDSDSHHSKLPRMGNNKSKQESNETFNSNSNNKIMSDEKMDAVATGEGESIRNVKNYLSTDNDNKARRDAHTVVVTSILPSKRDALRLHCNLISSLYSTYTHSALDPFL